MENGEQDMIDQVLKDAQTGDIIFFQNDESLSSKMIKSWLGSHITHVCMVFRPKESVSIKELGDLEKDQLYAWEMGRNTEAKTQFGTGNNFTEARLVSLQEMLELRKTNIYWKKLRIRSELSKNQGFRNFVLNKIRDRIRDYIFSKVTSPYDPYISAFWLMKDGIWPFPSRFHHKIEDQFLPVEKGCPKHCSQLIFQTCAAAYIFRTRKDNYIISPGELFDLTNEFCSPFVFYSDAILIKQTK